VQGEMQRDVDNYDEMPNQLALLGVDDSTDEEESDNHQAEVTVTESGVPSWFYCPLVYGR